MKRVANRFHNQVIYVRKRETLSAVTQIQLRILFCFGALCARKQQLKLHGNCFISAITKREGFVKKASKRRKSRIEKFKNDSTSSLVLC